MGRLKIAKLRTAWRCRNFCRFYIGHVLGQGPEAVNKVVKVKPAVFVSVDVIKQRLGFLGSSCDHECFQEGSEAEDRNPWRHLRGTTVGRLLTRRLVLEHCLESPPCAAEALEHMVLQLLPQSLDQADNINRVIWPDAALARHEKPLPVLAWRSRFCSFRLLLRR